MGLSMNTLWPPVTGRVVSADCYEHPSSGISSELTLSVVPQSPELESDGLGGTKSATGRPAPTQLPDALVIVDSSRER
jgi:hypothetical protein